MGLCRLPSIIASKRGFIYFQARTTGLNLSLKGNHNHVDMVLKVYLLPDGINWPIAKLYTTTVSVQHTDAERSNPIIQMKLFYDDGRI